MSLGWGLGLGGREKRAELSVKIEGQWGKEGRWRMGEVDCMLGGDLNCEYGGGSFRCVSLLCGLLRGDGAG